jgi:hypothetical protein
MTLRIVVPGDGETLMSKKTEYGEWLSTQMVNQDAEIDVLGDKAESATNEAESGYCSANAAQELERDQTALKLQSMSLSSDYKWHEITTESTNTPPGISPGLRDTIFRDVE